MPKVYSAFDRPKGEPSKPGSGIAPEYSIRLDQDGHKEVYKSGEVDIYAKIQAAAESCTIDYILRTCTDVSILADTAGSYIDLSAAPTTLMEANNLVLAGLDEFNRLPANVKAKFDNDPGVYFAQYGSAAWAENLGIVQNAENSESSETGSRAPKEQNAQKEGTE